MSANTTNGGRTLRRVVLAIGLALASVAPLEQTHDVVRAADSSTWYWQNPLPRKYSVTAVACRSVTACVAVGASGTIVSTYDGGQHWADRPSGTKIGLQSVTCPGSGICYALGSQVTEHSPTGQLKGVQTVIIRSADGGRTWRPPAAHFPAGPAEVLSLLACPSASICLVGGYDVASGAPVLLRTTDSGRTWHAVSLSGLNSLVTMTCATMTICYFSANIHGRSSLARSDDSGKTWKLHGLRSPSPRNLIAMACPAANTCFATEVYCGSECDQVGHIDVTRDGARTWKRVYNGPAAWIACPSATTCYAAADRSAMSTTNGGKSWSVHRLLDEAGSLVCPGHSTCYATALFAVLKTSDGFGHTRETLAHSVIHSQLLTDISCPNNVTCYVSGSRSLGGNDCEGPCVGPASFAVTTNGGRKWRATPKTPNLLQRLSCPRVSVCFAIGGSDPGAITVDLSDDGAQTWHQIGWQQISTRLARSGQASDVTCVAGTTCYLLATVGEDLQGNNVFVQHVAVLVTRDTGQTWSVQTGIDTAARAGGTVTTTNILPSRISCPSVTTCFVLATVYNFTPPTTPPPGQTTEQIVILSTTDGGARWTRHLTVPDMLLSSGDSSQWQDLSCPSTTTCYLLSQNPGAGGLPGRVLVSHDAGATWQSSVVSSEENLRAISCAAAQSCRVVGSLNTFATDDGGMTWQREFLPDGSPFALASITCPAVDTCYSVGGPIILATHPPGRPRTSAGSAGAMQWHAVPSAVARSLGRPGMGRHNP